RRSPSRPSTSPLRSEATTRRDRRQRLARGSPTRTCADEPGSPSLSTTPAPDGTREWAVLAARAADEKLGVDTMVFDVGDVLAVTDLFVVTSGGSARQVKAIVEEIERKVA